MPGLVLHFVLVLVVALPDFSRSSYIFIVQQKVCELNRANATLSSFRLTGALK